MLLVFPCYPVRSKITKDSIPGPFGPFESGNFPAMPTARARLPRGNRMTIQEFAERNRVKCAHDACGDPVIRGRIDESNIYEYSDTELGVAFITDAGKPPRTGLWKGFKVACLSAGMTLRQEGDAEGCFSFDPTNETQAKVALKGIRVRIKKQMSPEMLAHLAEARLKVKKPLTAALVSS
jgi:hypothetical protein